MSRMTAGQSDINRRDGVANSEFGAGWIKQDRIARMGMNRLRISGAVVFTARLRDRHHGTPAA
ncbi:MAG TPA: hypothetical protein VFE47_00485 [Tepidisphaeraceae bacterium]|jgi:hypothetical protein|nr:hypothetical protein [Tepidisphaeraceae bacterium]